MLTDDKVTLAQALGALWPILTTLGGGYLCLLGIIYKLMGDRLEELRTENKELRAEVKAFTAPLEAISDTSSEMNRTLREVLDGILPRGPRERDR